MTKPVILVDMDGVLVDFDGWIYDHSYLWPSLSPNRSAQTHYFLTDEVSKGDAAAMRKAVNEGRIFRDAKPIPGAIEGLNRLREVADVWICTRPLEANRNCRDDKAAWLRTHFDADLEKRLIITSNKSLVRGAILLDDHPKEKEIKQAVWRPVVYDQPFNQWQDGYGPWDAYPHYNWLEDPVEDLLHYADPHSWG